MSTDVKIDVLWVLLCSILVMFMQVGFCCLESGSVRSKNSINVALKNILDFVLGAFLFWVVGFSSIFGSSLGGIIGVGSVFSVEGASPVDITFFLFQLMFSTTAVTIISGAVAERLRLRAYLVIVGVVSVLVYPAYAHWAWGGDVEHGFGWLRSLGFVDFAGSAVVHAIGGGWLLQLLL